MNEQMDEWMNVLESYVICVLGQEQQATSRNSQVVGLFALDE